MVNQNNFKPKLRLPWIALGVSLLVLDVLGYVLDIRETFRTMSDLNESTIQILFFIWIFGLAALSTAVILATHSPGFIRLLRGVVWRSNKDEALPLMPNFPAWEALQYISKDTGFGRDKQPHEVVAALRQAAVHGRITVWACTAARKPHTIIPKDKFAEYTFALEPGGSGGMIQKNGGWLSGGDVYYAPMFSRQEIEREFGKR